mgnify:FL=1
MKPLNWPLMHNNILPEDKQALIKFLESADILTQASNVEAFEAEWSRWLGVKYSVFVNSGASANLLTMNIVALMKGRGEVIVPPVTWVSDIASVIQTGHKPIFVDISRKHLGMRTDKILQAIGPNTKAVFLTHLLGLNALTTRLVEELERRKIWLIEDCCEAHGATFKGRKLGSIGAISNFSFYYAHHLSTVEGGMICTNSEEVYNVARMLRSHGLLRESKSQIYKEQVAKEHPDLNSQFIFMYPAYNVRSTELNAVIGRSQLLRLDENNKRRRENLAIFLGHLDPTKYQTKFRFKGCSPYALILVLKNQDKELADKAERLLKDLKVECRRGLSGGGNQLRQPFLAKRAAEFASLLPNAEHIHSFSWYVGNYPTLEKEKITDLCVALNAL